MELILLLHVSIEKHHDSWLFSEYWELYILCVIVISKLELTTCLGGADMSILTIKWNYKE